jgi:hypothetical protein
LPNGQHRAWCRDGHAALSEARYVNARARKRHGWVNGNRNGSHAAGRRENIEPELGRRVHDNLPRLPRPCLGESGNEVCELIIWNCEQHEFASFDDVRHVENRNTGQQGLGPVA